MQNDKTLLPDAAALRSRAEERLAEKTARSENPFSEEDSVRLIHELQVHQVELELQNEELCGVRAALEEANELYLDLYDRAPAGYLSLDDKGVIRQANLTIARLLSTERARLLGQSIFGYLDQGLRGVLLQRLASVGPDDVESTLEIELVKRGGGKFHAQLEISALFNPGEPARGHRVVIIDISRLKSAENQLIQANESLEREVSQRTEALVTTNQTLQAEIVQHQLVARELEQSKTALEAKTTQLEQANIALTVMFRRAEEDREILEGNIMEQVNKLLLPCLRDVLSAQLDSTQRQRMETALGYLEQLTSSFAQKLGSSSLGLSGREIEIAGLISQGMSSKDISSVLNISTDTVSFHRRNIRRKLGMTKTSSNLAARLGDMVK